MDIQEAEYFAFTTQIIGHYLLYEIFLMMYLFLCVCFSWDLWQTIKNPLYPANKRLRWYILTSILLMLVLFGIEFMIIEGSVWKAFDLNNHEYDLEGYMV
jgi:hypothetical protein